MSDKLKFVAYGTTGCQPLVTRDGQAGSLCYYDKLQEALNKLARECQASVWIDLPSPFGRTAGEEGP